VKKNLFLLLPLASKHGNLLILLPLATKHGNLLLLFSLVTKWGSSFTSFLLFKRAKLNHLELSFPDIIFNSNLEKTCPHNLFG
jgi:hypothetical protein